MNDLNNQLSDLLKKDSWTDEERKLLLNYLENSDGNELQELMAQQYAATNSSDLHSAASQKMLDEIHLKLGIERKEQKVIPIRTWMKRIAVAASLLLLIGFGAKYFLSKTAPSSLVQQHTKPVDSLLVRLQHEVNNTGIEKRFWLPDSSFIILAPNSEITYQEPFTDKRDITLIGKAYFKVAKDKTRPFTVVSGAVSTTALGTEFLVTAYENTEKLMVRLYEGKVVVKAVERENWRMKSDFYLMPGQEFIYNQQALAKVRTFSSKNTDDDLQADNKPSNDQPSVPNENSDGWYMFNNESLGTVLDDLAAFYNTKIIYNKKDLRKIYFIGKYNKSDSLENILQRIGTLNNLKITKNDTAFIITKKD